MRVGAGVREDPLDDPAVARRTRWIEWADGSMFAFTIYYWRPRAAA